jgi:hypothetical protein
MVAIAARRTVGETERVSRSSGTKLVLTGVMLAWAAAGCSSLPAVTGGSVTSCYQFAAGAIQHHVTVTARPAACQGLSQVQVNVAVSRALRAAAAGVRGKIRQRQVIALDGPYVARLLRAVPPAGLLTTSASPSGTASPSASSGGRALGLAALAAWLVTAGLGVSMMARWITRARRRGARPGHGPRPVLNFTHLGLALAGLLTWICYLATGVTGLAWAGCGLLLAVASLGMTLVFAGPAVTATGGEPEAGAPRTGHPPVFVIAVHVTLACATILLATLAAIGAG